MKQTMRVRPSGMVRATLVGAGYGIAASISGTFVSDFIQHVPVDWAGLLYEQAVVAPGGAIVALVLLLTKRFRNRGMVYYYASWVFACTIAFAILMLRLERSEGWWGIWFALWMGFSVGIGLAAFARYVQRPPEP